MGVGENSKLLNTGVLANSKSRYLKFLKIGVVGKGAGFNRPFSIP